MAQDLRAITPQRQRAWRDSAPSGETAIAVHWYSPWTADLPATVQAVAAVISIYFAYRAAKIGLQAILEQRHSREIEKRERYFSRYVVDIAMQCVPAFRENATIIVENVVREVSSLSPSTQQQEVQDRIAAAIEAFSAELYQLRERLSFADDALGETSLWSRIEMTLSKLEDGTVNGIAELAMPAKRNARLAAVVRQYSGHILREIYHFDVANHVPKKELSALRRVRRRVLMSVSNTIRLWS